MTTNLKTSGNLVTIGANSGNVPFSIESRMTTRHGLIAGATGTGKTVTLQVLAEQFSALGSAVFLADVKGDLSGLLEAGEPSRVTSRLQQLQRTDHIFRGQPVTFWDLFGEAGIPVRITVSEVGPLLLSHILELTQTQSEVMQIIFSIADDHGLLLLDLKDLETLLGELIGGDIIEKGSYGALHPNSLGAIQRRVIVLRESGGERFFGEPALSVEMLLSTPIPHTTSGSAVPSTTPGMIHLLQAQKLVASPRLYSAFLLWLLSELFEDLPEVGDIDVPKLVFFFDEAHLLFSNASKKLEEQIISLVRLIRSKGVSVFFISQHPLDLPDEVNAQLGTRIQHGLRAYTEKELRNVRAVAKSFRANPAFDTFSTLTELAVGEALVSSLDSTGTPTPVERVVIAPPHSRIGPCQTSIVAEVLPRSPLYSALAHAVDRESAHEVLLKRRKEPDPPPPQEKPDTKERSSSSSSRMSTSEAFSRSLLRSVGSYLGRTIARGILGTISKGSAR